MWTSGIAYGRYTGSSGSPQTTTVTRARARRLSEAWQAFGRVGFSPPISINRKPVLSIAEGSAIRNPKSSCPRPRTPLSGVVIPGHSVLDTASTQHTTYAIRYTKNGRVGFSPPISINRKPVLSIAEGSAIRNPKSSCPRPGFPLSFLLVRISGLP